MTMKADDNAPAADRHSCLSWCGRIRGCASTEWHAVVQLSGNTLSVTATDLSATYTGNVVVVQQHDGEKQCHIVGHAAANTTGIATATPTTSIAPMRTPADTLAVLKHCLANNCGRNGDNNIDDDATKTAAATSAHRLIRVIDRMNHTHARDNNNNNNGCRKQLRISMTWGNTNTSGQLPSSSLLLLPKDLCIDLDVVSVDLHMQAASTMPFMQCMMTWLTQSRTRLHNLAYTSRMVDAQIEDIEQAKRRIDESMTTEAKQARRLIFLNALNMYKHKLKARRTKTWSR